MEERTGGWLQTYTGKQFWPFDPRPEDICIEDIAHALSNQCRFAGHCTDFYSVAQHCVHASFHVPSRDALWALLHDSPEAYLVDLPRPIKRYSTIGTEYSQVEDRLMQCICEKYNLPQETPESVKKVDWALLMNEKRDLMPNSPVAWEGESTPDPYVTIWPWVPKAAKQSFIDRFNFLRSLY